MESKDKGSVPRHQRVVISLDSGVEQTYLPSSDVEKRSLTVPPATDRNAAPQKPVT